MADDQKPRFDLTFNLGHAIIIATALGGFVGSNYLTDHRLAALETQNAAIVRKLDGFTTLLIDAAVTTERLKQFERRLEFVERR